MRKFLPIGLLFLLGGLLVFYLSDKRESQPEDMYDIEEQHQSNSDSDEDGVPDYLDTEEDAGVIVLEDSDGAIELIEEDEEELSEIKGVQGLRPQSDTTSIPDFKDLPDL